MRLFFRFPGTSRYIPNRAEGSFTSESLNLGDRVRVMIMVWLWLWLVVRVRIKIRNNEPHALIEIMNLRNNEPLEKRHVTGFPTIIRVLHVLGLFTFIIYLHILLYYIYKYIILDICIYNVYTECIVSKRDPGQGTSVREVNMITGKLAITNKNEC